MSRSQFKILLFLCTAHQQLFFDSCKMARAGKWKNKVRCEIRGHKIMCRPVSILQHRPLCLTITHIVLQCRLCFTFAEDSEEFICKILDSGLLQTRLADKGRQLMGQEWIEPPRAVRTLTFGDIDGCALQFHHANPLRPYRRVMSFQARQARAEALDRNWITDGWDFHDYASEGEDVPTQVGSMQRLAQCTVDDWLVSHKRHSEVHVCSANAHQLVMCRLLRDPSQFLHSQVARPPLKATSSPSECKVSLPSIVASACALVLSYCEICTPWQLWWHDLMTPCIGPSKEHKQ